MLYTTIILCAFIIWNLPTQSKADCSDPTAMTTLDVNSILGTWYEYKTHQRVYGNNGKCGTVNFTRNERDERVIDMKFTQIVGGEEIVDLAKLKKNNLEDKTGNFEITYFLKKRSLFYHTLDIEKETNVFSVLGTDGDCWAVTFTCDKNILDSNDRLTVLVRTRDRKCFYPKVTRDIEAELNKVHSLYGAVTMYSTILTTEQNQNGCQ